MKAIKKYLIRRNDGRYYGNSVWTFDEDRAIRFKTKEAAKERSKTSKSLKIVCITESIY